MILLIDNTVLLGLVVACLKAKSPISSSLLPGKLITEVIGIHENNIIVNASVYNTNLDALIVPVKLCVEHEYTKEEAEKDKTIRSYTIKGVTPCSFDLFRYRVYLKEVKVGDELVFLNAGAYNFASDFCDLEKLKTLVVDNFNI